HQRVHTILLELLRTNDADDGPYGGAGCSHARPAVVYDSPSVRVLRVFWVVVVLWFAANAHAQPESSDEDDDAPADSTDAAPPADERPAEEAPAEPPPPTTGTIDGLVEAPDLDAPLAGATVTIVGTNTT